jgi:hypothetical protein
VNWHPDGSEERSVKKARRNEELEWARVADYEV